MPTPGNGRLPAEWMPHRAVWLAWPYRPDCWPGNLEAARGEMAGFCRALAGAVTTFAGGEAIEVLVRDTECETSAARLLEGLPVRLTQAVYADIWLRDTGPVFVTTDEGLLALGFGFNGWGGRYLFPDDLGVAATVAELGGHPLRTRELVFEGGSVDVDGEGTGLASRQCLLNPNRNASMDAASIERELCAALGLDVLLWLESGLAGDHTDGHVDTLARFVMPGHVAFMEPGGASDPNRDTLVRIRRDLLSFRDGCGRRLELIPLPSPGAVLGDEGELLPASYLNFYVGNDAVVVPAYGSSRDGAAVDALALCFPGRRVVGSSARTILTGGGAFHCMTREEPCAGEGAEGEVA